MILYGRDRDERDDSANRYPIGTRVLAAQQAQETGSDDDPHDLEDAPTQLAQSDYNAIGKSVFVICLSCLLAWLLILALSVGPLSKKVDRQKAAGQTIGYRNTAPLSPPTPSPAPPSSSASAIPLQEILTGVPSLRSDSHSTPSVKESRP